MNKSELLEKIKDFSDDTEIVLFNRHAPSAHIIITHDFTVDYYEDAVVRSINPKGNIWETIKQIRLGVA